MTGLPRLQQSIAKLREDLAAVESAERSCILCMGWGGGFVSKSSFANTDNEHFRTLLKSVPAVARVIRNDVPFPKTRRVIFAAGQPAYLPGWVRLDLESEQKNAG